MHHIPPFQSYTTPLMLEVRYLKFSSATLAMFGWLMPPTHAPQDCNMPKPLLNFCKKTTAEPLRHPNLIPLPCALYSPHLTHILATLLVHRLHLLPTQFRMAEVGECMNMVKYRSFAYSLESWQAMWCGVGGVFESGNVMWSCSSLSYLARSLMACRQVIILSFDYIM